MEYLRIRKWSKYQTYRTDRGAPPWIKIHKKLMTNDKWALLSDSEKGHLISIWLTAADRQGRIPADPHVVRKMALLDDAPDLNKFIDLGFLASSGRQDDVKMTSSGRQVDAPEERRGEEMRGEIKPLVDSDKPNPTRKKENKQEKEKKAKTKEKYANEFDAHIWPIYPKRAGTNPKKPARTKYITLRSNGIGFSQLRDATMRYALLCEKTSKLHTEGVLQAQTFFGPNERWNEDFALPKEKLELPDDDAKLEGFAIKHGLPRPKNERNYYQYRAVLRDAMQERGL